MMANSALWSAGASTFNESSGVVLPPLDLPQSITGFKRSAVKTGVMFGTPSTMPETEEFWPRVYKTDNIPDWPSDKYPLLMDSSSDHSSGDGGVYLRVYEKSLGSPIDGAAWHEWDDISNEPEFSHITQKTNPIYINEVRGSQTETPQRVVVGGNIYLFTHNGGVSTPSDPSYGGNTQVTARAVSTNGVDFTGTTFINPYNPKFTSGNGHGGYFDVGLNTIPEIPYTYIGRTAKGGGTDSLGPSQRILVSNDIEAEFWEEYADWGRHQGELVQYAEAGKENWIYQIATVANAKREGAYYRVIGLFRPNIESGGADEGSTPCELLVDHNFNVVGQPNLILEPTPSTFDEDAVQDYWECEFEGVTYAFYKGLGTSSAESVICGATVEDELSTWEIFNPLSQYVLQQNHATTTGATAGGLTYTPSASYRLYDRRELTSLLLDVNESVSTAVSSGSLILAEHDVIDIHFKGIGKDSDNPILFEFGLTDSVSSPSAQLNYRWNARTQASGVARSEKMIIDVLGSEVDGETLTRNYFGQSGGRNTSLNDDESAPAKHEVGLRIIPAQNKMIVLGGVCGYEIIDITGFDYLKSLNVFIKANLTGGEATENDTVSFEAIQLLTYSADAIEVPASPTITTTKTTDSVTLSASNISGATGYKYFLDGLEQDNGNFTGLEPDTEYTVYARASNALGDSAPSTIQTVTTDAEEVPNHPPTASAGIDQSVAAGVTVQLDGTGSTDGDGTIVSYSWAQTAGDAVILTGASTSTPSFTAPSTNAQQTLTFELTVTDNEAATDTDTADVAVAAEVVQPIESTLNLTITGISAGSQALKLWSETDNTLVYDSAVTFAGESASITLQVAAGTVVTGRWLGTNPPTTGTGIYGVTV